MLTLYETIANYQYIEKEAIYFENNSITYKMMFTKINKMVNYFKTFGIKKGDVVTLVLPNIPSCIYAIYALNAIGAIENILHPLTPIEEIFNSMNETKSKVLISLGTNYDKIKKYDNPNNYIFLLANPYYDKNIILRSIFNLKYKCKYKQNNIFRLDKYNKFDDRISVENHDSSKTSIYLHSGGTTGNSKIIGLSDDSINNLAIKVQTIVENKKHIKMLAVLPTFHGFGLGMGIHAPLANGASVTLMMKFDAKKIAKYINKHKINYIIGIPRLYEKLLANKKFLHSKIKYLKACFVGGDNVPIRLIEQFNKLMKEKNSKAQLLEGYGLTETVTVCFVNTNMENRLGSVGKPLPGIKVKILTEDQKEQPINEVGEIYISGNTLMNEYLFDKEETQKTLLLLDGKKWVRTGDMGYLDDNGFLFIKGRKKRLIIISGYNVFPNEIEKVVMEIEDVDNAVIIYFENDKPHMNLYVIQNKNSIINEEALKNKIKTKLEAKFIKYSLPSNIIFMEKFPRTKMGKIDQSQFKDI